ncbi:MAG: hypothetical protein JWP03_441 [Phycisphaerales bacterium]|jgi:hypothetical protein|nr:hypothetical protein [Phycisphaerales bacterium]
MQTIEYQSPKAVRPPSGGKIAWCSLGVACATIAANIWLVYPAASDRSWGAINVLLFKGPTTNLCILLTALALAPVVRRYSRGAAILPYVLTSVFVPVAGVMLDSIYILSMGLHGC